jgi:transcriptional regulator with XRE-family HTH domain
MTPKNLREYFEQSEESQRQFAERMGLSQGYVSRLAAREITPSLPVAIRIARATGIPVESFAPTAEPAA